MAGSLQTAIDARDENNIEDLLATFEGELRVVLEGLVAFLAARETT